MLRFSRSVLCASLLRSTGVAPPSGGKTRPHPSRALAVWRAEFERHDAERLLQMERLSAAVATGGGGSDNEIAETLQSDAAQQTGLVAAAHRLRQMRRRVITPQQKRLMLHRVVPLLRSRMFRTQLLGPKTAPLVVDARFMRALEHAAFFEHARAVYLASRAQALVTAEGRVSASKSDGMRLDEALTTPVLGKQTRAALRERVAHELQEAGAAQTSLGDASQCVGLLFLMERLRVPLDVPLVEAALKLISRGASTLQHRPLTTLLVWLATPRVSAMATESPAVRSAVVGLRDAVADAIAAERITGVSGDAAVYLLLAMHRLDAVAGGDGATTQPDVLRPLLKATMPGVTIASTAQTKQRIERKLAAVAQRKLDRHFEVVARREETGSRMMRPAAVAGIARDITSVPRVLVGEKVDSFRRQQAACIDAAYSDVFAQLPATTLLGLLQFLVVDANALVDDPSGSPLPPLAVELTAEALARSLSQLHLRDVTQALTITAGVFIGKPGVLRATVSLCDASLAECIAWFHDMGRQRVPSFPPHFADVAARFLVAVGGLHSRGYFPGGGERARNQSTSARFVVDAVGDAGRAAAPKTVKGAVRLVLRLALADPQRRVFATLSSEQRAQMREGLTRLAMLTPEVDAALASRGALGGHRAASALSAGLRGLVG